LEREPELVALDVTQGKVSQASAHDDYGVVLRRGLDESFEPDLAATERLRAELRSERGFVPFIDRGPGYRQLSGRDDAEVDLV
jgi:N-methylhydantoinase B